MDDIKPVVMIGAGPSSLAAAIYTTREDIDTVLYEKAVVGGLAAITDVVDNYPGFSEGVKGMDLAEQLQKQAERFGAKIEYGDVTSLKREADAITMTVDGKTVRADAVLIATGSDYNKMGIPGEAEYYGRGVHYCATCDGAFYRDKRLIVVGGGNSAVQETVFLTRYASRIDILVRSTIKASQVLQDDLQQYIDSGKVVVHLDVTPDEIIGQDANSIRAVKATQDGQPIEFETDGVFVFIGLKPNTQFLEGSGIELDARGLIVTNKDLETALPGVFASGDVRSNATMQVASAVGEGATAALNIRKYLEGVERTRRETTN
ncbi:MAG: FAD-dependent oxidoreductase [Candidatus Saccharimonas sp.]